ncbi:HAD family hydrolase [Acaricomes phytoseiuli]|uniref:HAD family hydrolase n=1 Tax=Acaricomes phytoseiuli TaxID=291968 RepID=UPI0003661CBD|nr:HAD family hydrolase [Acaricomes phytoseiuli]MCW1249705.1 HAD family hydrolase [Acaricomes phytoseiuli]
MRLIASDIDGTILAHDGRISSRTIEAFRAASAAGIEIVFVTGRPPRWLGPLREQIGHQGTVICSNGALVYDLATESALSSSCLAVPDLLAAQQAIRRLEPLASFAAETLDGLYLEPGYLTASSPPALRDIEPRPLAESLAGGPGVLKFLAKSPQGTADEFLELVRPAITQWVKATHSAAGVALLEMSRCGVNKAITLAEYARSRGIPAADVVAFGDMPNDIEMLGWAGRGYAMGDGHPAALAATSWHAPDFAADGVAQVIEERLACRTA